MKTHDFPSPQQASFLLNRAIEDGKLKTADLNRYQRDMEKEIEQLEERLILLKSAENGGVMTRKVRQVAEPKVKRHKQTLTPQLMESRKVQGQFLGYIRQIPQSKRGHYQKVAKDHGREVAIKEMREALGR